MHGILKYFVFSLLCMVVLGAAQPSRAGIVEANIDAAVFDLVDNLRKSDVSRVGVEMSQTHHDYINESDRKRILALIERYLSQQSEGKFTVISRTSTRQAQRESQNTKLSFAEFVNQQSIDTIIRLSTYDFQGGLKFNLEAAPYGLTKLIGASEQYLLIDSVQDLNRFSPQRAMHLISKELGDYLIETADHSYSTPFSVKAEGQKATDKLTNYLKNLALSELSIQWENRFNRPGVQALDDSIQGKVETGPWNLDVEANIHNKGVSVTVALIRDGLKQTMRFIEIDKAQIDPGLLTSTLDMPFTPTSTPERPETTSVQAIPFVAEAKAVINDELIKQEAVTAAKLLARARAISAALDLDPPKIGLVRRSSEIPHLISYLNLGLPYNESWTVKQTEDLVDVSVELKVIPLSHSEVTARLRSPVLLSGDPLEMTVLSEKSLYFGLFGWQADGTVIRIFPFRHRDKIRLNEDRPTLLPSKQFGLDALTSIPLEGAQSNHEALVLITSNRPLDLGRLAKRVARKNENWQKRGHRDSQFFNMLSLQIQGAAKGTSIRFVPYQVVDKQ